MSHEAERIGFLISLCKHSLTAAIAEAYHGIILEEIEKRRPCHEPCLGNDEREAGSIGRIVETEDVSGVSAEESVIDVARFLRNLPVVCRLLQRIVERANALNPNP